MELITKKLEEYGADTDSALKRLLDDEELYISCVTAFTEDAGFAALGKALTDRNYDEAFNQAHTLKGVAANLSLTPLLKGVADIVEALRAGEHTQLEMQYAYIVAQQDMLKHIVHK